MLEIAEIFCGTYAQQASMHSMHACVLNAAGRVAMRGPDLFALEAFALGDETWHSKLTSDMIIKILFEHGNAYSSIRVGFVSNLRVGVQIEVGIFGPEPVLRLAYAE